METSDIVRNNRDREYQIVTFGAWEIKEPLVTTFILENNDIIRLNERIEKLTTQFRRYFQYIDNIKTQPYLRFLEFMSEKFIQNEPKGYSKYKISCAFSNYIFSKKGNDLSDNKVKNIDAIIYTSAIDSTSVNFSVHPRAIENGKLKIIAACKSTMRKLNRKHYYEENLVEAKSIDNNSGLIKWV